MEKDIFIKENNTIVEALKKLDKTAEKTLLVVDVNKKLLGTVTDGDIRRYILKNGKLQGLVKEFYNRAPIYIHENQYSIRLVKQILINNMVELLPILDSNNKIIKFVTWIEIFGKEKIVNSKKNLNIPVIIMAGGKGTRLEPFTKVLPKPLIPIGDKAIIDLIIENFHKFGIKKFYLSINYRKDMIKAYFNSKINSEKIDIEYIEEDEYLGTAGSLYYLNNKIESDFIVSNCDILINASFSDVYKFHKENHSALTIITSIQHIKVPYGIVEIQNGGKIFKIDEKPEFSFQINTGVYILNNKIFEMLSQKQKIDMPDLIKKISKNNRIYAYPVNESDYFDIGEWEKYIKAIEKFEKRFYGKI